MNRPFPIARYEYTPSTLLPQDVTRLRGSFRGVSLADKCPVDETLIVWRK